MKKATRAQLSVGARYGSLTVKAVYRVPEHDRAQAIASCDCGNEWTGDLAGLKRGVVESCGCVGRRRRRESTRKPPGFAALTKPIAVYKYKAQNHNQTWTLTDEETRTLMLSRCWYEQPGQPCKPNQAAARLEKVDYYGLDRVDNTRGYEPGNVVPCCKRHNFMKKDFSLEGLKWLVARMEAHQALAADPNFSPETSFTPSPSVGVASSTAALDYAYEE